jgi:hypothetical protein
MLMGSVRVTAKKRQLSYTFCHGKSMDDASRMQEHFSFVIKIADYFNDE